MKKIKFVLEKLGNTERLRELGLIIILLLLVVVIQLRNSNFLRLENFADMLKNTAILGILTMGMVMVIITRGIDLSIGSTLALAGMSVSLMVFKYPAVSPVMALLLGLLIGILCGALIGVMIAVGKVSPIIATLGVTNIYRGITFGDLYFFELNK